MRLLGSTTSPYTRKIRILLRSIGRQHDLVDTRTDKGAAVLAVAKQRQRVERTLTWLDGRIAFRRPLGGAALSLGCALDWITFRDVVDVARWPGLAAFREAWTSSGVGAGSEPRE